MAGINIMASIGEQHQTVGLSWLASISWPASESSTRQQGFHGWHQHHGQHRRAASDKRAWPRAPRLHRVPHLRDLSGLAGSGLGHDDHDLVLLNGLQNLLSERVDGQGRAVSGNLLARTLCAVGPLLGFPLLGLLRAATCVCMCTCA